MQWSANTYKICSASLIKKEVKTMLTHQYITARQVQVLARVSCGRSTHRPWVYYS